MLSIGSPTPDKLQKVLDLYEALDHRLIGFFDAGDLIGVIGLKIQKTKAIIKHLAVAPDHRLKGVGKVLIKYVMDRFLLKIIYAETDDDTIDFYRKLGFICRPFKGQYGKRYTCEYTL